MNIRLRDGTIYAVADYAEPNNFTILLNGMDAEAVIATLTEENLSEIQFMTDSGEVTGAYLNQMLYGYTADKYTLDVFIKAADLCRYGLTLDADNRIVSVVEQRYAPDGAIIVDELPDGNYSDYLYVDGEYVYDPLPVPEQPEEKPTQEERITALEAALNDLGEGAFHTVITFDPEAFN